MERFPLRRRRRDRREDDFPVNGLSSHEVEAFMRVRERITRVEADLDAVEEHSLKGRHLDQMREYANAAGMRAEDYTDERIEKADKAQREATSYQIRHAISELKSELVGMMEDLTERAGDRATAATIAALKAKRVTPVERRIGAKTGAAVGAGGLSILGTIAYAAFEYFSR